ncbi:type I polyketide synthase [Luteimonas sp. MC1782]|uniref:type I polyketide synthase n=1 Tax=Luteimonas sp. MC1782 TaxID=2760305 RepID=UPI001600F7F1|nr:type I polyketide synthase [Luteimonas sp. MC1782]MBB1473152.1 type I polyketide synthase [Luteimonas sp. MC1782]
MSHEGIAIVGMSGRFPGAPDVDTFWKNIKDGVESVTHFDPSELEIPLAPDTGDDPNARYICAKGILDDVDMFDARFFGYLPREAELMDPQHRMFLEICWEAMERAGHDPQRYPGAVGVYAGCYMDTYLLWNLCSDPTFLARFVESIQVGSLQTELGNDKDYLATRVAFKLGLRGPAMTLQTACSTSLVAIATACQALASYQCDMALAGGVTIVLPQKKGYFYREGSMLSADGHCRTFDEQAAGTVFSNGAAVVLLKRVEDAIADGDRIYAVVRGFAVNNDGAGKVSYTAPSVDGQADVISMALAAGDIDARSIGYVEAHGTATPMGDPIEIAGLTAAYRAHTLDHQYCAIGSLKANLGHLDVSSGAIGLIKTALSVDENLLVPSINFTRPNPKIDFAQSPFYVNTELKPWPQAPWPRRAGISSFGVGGTNAHLVVEQAPEPPPEGNRRSHALLLLSARSKEALAAQATRLADWLEANPAASLDDVAYTLQVGRQQFEHRRIVVAAEVAEAAVKLRAAPTPVEAASLKASAKAITFMFPGQGAQYPGMARELYGCEPLFREVIDRCGAALCEAGAAEQDPRPLLLWDAQASPLDAAQATAALAQTAIAQPAIFAMEMALATLLGSWGVKPDAALGHSVGEFAAACMAGVFALDDAVRLVATRGRLMQAQPRGTMLAIRAPREQVEPRLPRDVAIAAVNAPGLVVVSGPVGAVDGLAKALAAEDIQATPLLTSHAFHSRMMAPARAPLVEAVAAVPSRAASLPLVSTATGATIDAEGFREPGYWGDQLMRPVLFAEASATAAADGALLLEVGPGRTLTTLARQSLDKPGPLAVLPCLGPVQAPGSDVQNLLQVVGQLWLAGVQPDWAALQPGRRRRVPLPTYPFERKRFWVQPIPPGPATQPAPRAAACGSAVTGARSAAVGVPSDVEQLIRMQLALISEQLGVIGGLGGTGRGDR